MSDERAAPSPPLGDPTVIVRDVHITYTTYGGKRNALRPPDAGRLSRALKRASQHIGAVTQVEAVRGVSLIARHGESIGIIGRNGSGKSTLLRGIAGLAPLTRGEVYTRGEVALLGVSAALIKQLSGDRNIMLGGLALGLTRQQVRQRYDEIVDFSGIGEFVRLPMSSYSSGMAARLRFAVSAAAVPDILVIDEALSTGDAEFRRRSAEKVARIREEAGTVFVVSHSNTDIRRMCSRVVWLDEGKVRRDGEAETVLAEYEDFVRSLDRKAPKPRQVPKSS